MKGLPKGLDDESVSVSYTRSLFGLKALPQKVPCTNSDPSLLSSLLVPHSSRADLFFYNGSFSIRNVSSTRLLPLPVTTLSGLQWSRWSCVARTGGMG